MSREEEHRTSDASKWEKKYIQGAIIRSFITVSAGTDDTLLHIRVRSHWIPLDRYGLTYPQESNVALRATERLTYPDNVSESMKEIVNIDEDTAQQIYCWVVSPEWMDMTDFKGKIVPLEILVKMQRANKVIPPNGYQGRDIDVGETAWKVLTDWYETEMARENAVQKKELEVNEGALELAALIVGISED